MGDRDERGRFKVGNKLGMLTRKSELQEIKSATRSEIIHCAHTLIQPHSTLAADMKDKNISRLGHMTCLAVKEGNINWIKWLLEMAVGRPKEHVDPTEPYQEDSDKLGQVTTEELTSFIKKVASNASAP